MSFANDLVDNVLELVTDGRGHLFPVGLDGQNFLTFVYRDGPDGETGEQ